MSYTKILYHIIFRTKYSEKTIPLELAPELYRYMWGIITNKNCVLYRVNGMEEHVHLLIDLHPSVALSDFVKTLKVSSSKWMKESGFFPDFKGWGIKYCALTYSLKEKDILINYIKNQQEHHRNESFQEEIHKLWKEGDFEDDVKWFWVDS
ncbi:IS200/IS605 family transposase [Paenimyroides viscosum]|uniref:IS200/IS605 family transposase n=1 Tax=Paenimyroides viscosum TaxID=2488729 RepID=A0A3P1B1G0_9FLAO|nr:IS200/IS605 family transposase [Paenimyroides viscosum]RRA94805.1 IS200/IS605 family transposase [Paenimyroides viscosum]